MPSVTLSKSSYPLVWAFSLYWPVWYTLIICKLRLPIILVVFLVLIAVVNGFADAYHWYWTMRWFDNPMHFAGGAWLASFGVWWYYKRKRAPLTRFVHCWGVPPFLPRVGLLWEVYEAAISFLTGWSCKRDVRHPKRPFIWYTRKHNSRRVGLGQSKLK